MRAAQSKGMIDLLALWPIIPAGMFPIGGAPVSPWLVQCKTGSARMSRAEKLALVELADRTGAVPIIAQPRKSGRGIEFIDLSREEEIAL